MAEKDKQLVSQSEYLQMIIYAMRKQRQERVDQIQNPTMCYRSEFRFLLPEEIELFRKYPTAQKYMKAFENFRAGYSCLYNYGKENVVNESDCRYLENGFRAYAFGYVLENLMINQFSPPENTICLLEQYLALRPNDAFAEYFQLRLIKHIDENTIKKLMDDMVAAEKLAHKLELRTATLSQLEKMVLSDIYTLVGADYTTTDQHKRAVLCFEQAYFHDKKNTTAIYGIAYNLRNTDTRRSETLLRLFLETAPKCDKQYPNVLYNLSMLYLKGEDGMRKAERYFELAQLYEKHRLPFLPKVNLAAKDVLTPAMALRSPGRPELKYCFNPMCSSDEVEDLKACTRCKSVYYCGRDCQKKDWDFHKQACRS